MQVSESSEGSFSDKGTVSNAKAQKARGLQYKRRRWSPEEDKRLESIIEQHGAGNWSKISLLHGTRDGKQCRERWLYHIGPNVNKSPLTKEEMALLVQMQAQYGNRWSEISAMMPGRTAASIKNHWNATIAKFQKSQRSAFLGPGRSRNGACNARSKETGDLETSSSSECNARIRFPDSDPPGFGRFVLRPSPCSSMESSQSQDSSSVSGPFPDAPVCLLGDYDESFLARLHKASGLRFVSLSFRDVEAALNLAEYSTHANALWRPQDCRGALGSVKKCIGSVNNKK